MELREKFILPEGTTQVMASFRYRGRRSRPSSRGASPNRSTSSQSCPVPSHQTGSSALKVRGSALPNSLDCLSLDPTVILLPFICLSSVHVTLFDHVFLLFFMFLSSSVSCSFWFVNPCPCFLFFIWFSIVSQTPQHITRNYDKPWLTNSKPSTPSKSSDSFGSPGSSSEVLSCATNDLECFRFITRMKSTAWSSRHRKASKKFVKKWRRGWTDFQT